jgi:hypothetical protein
MKNTLTVLAVTLCAAFFTGCTTHPAPRWVYKESQFASHLEYLRFCQRYALLDYRCELSRDRG